MVKKINQHKIEKNTDQKAIGLVLILIVFNMGFIPGATIALNKSLFLDKVIIVFDNDKALAETSYTIKESYPDVKVVYYGSNKYFRVIDVKIVEKYILIAHGYEDGVLIKGKLVSWEEYADLTNSFHGELLYFVSCHSEKIRSYIPKARIGITIPGIIDAEIAGLLTSAMIAGFEGNREKSLDLMIESVRYVNLIDEGRKKLTPLLAIGNLKDWEIYLSLTELIIIILAILAGEIALSSNGVKTGVRTMVHTKYGHFGHIFAEIVHALFLGISVWELFMRLFEFLFTITSIINFILPYLTWIELITFGLGLAVSIGLTIASGSASWWVRAAVYTVVIGIWIYWLIVDASDPDSDWHHSSYSHESSSGGGSGGGGGGIGGGSGSSMLCFK